MRTWLLVAVMVVWVPVARARDGIVIESYSGDRPADATKTLEPVLTELAQRDFEAGDSIGRLYEGKVSRPRQNSLPADFAKQLKDGQQEYIRGNYAAAAAKLQPLIDMAHDNSGAFAKNQALRQTMLDALVALALAQDRGGDPKTAKLTLGELARSFPDAQVSAATWGASAAKLFADVQRDLKQQSQGRLIVKAPGSAEVYVNERFEQTGTVIKSVLPGDYRIFVREGAKQSRTYRVTVSSAVDANVSIDLDLDAAVRTSPWSGLQYDGTAERERFEAKHAAAFATAIDERAVVVVGIDTNKSVIFGALVNLSGRDERRASIPLSASENSKKQLARFLAGEPATADLVVIVGDGAHATSGPSGPSGPGPTGPREDGGSHRWGGWPILTGLVAAGAVGASVYWFGINGDCTDGSNDPNCPYFKETLPYAFISVGAGAVFAGLTIYLVVTRPKSSPNKTVFVVPTNGGAMAGASVRF